MSARSYLILRVAAPVVVVLVVVIGVYGVNLRTYRAAQLITATGADVQEISDNLNHFPPLATFARERLLNVMNSRLDQFDEFDRTDVIDQLEHEAMLALDAEPENMELHFAVARFYRAAASYQPTFIERARTYTERGVELGPNTGSAKLAQERQKKAESILETRG
jgi:hypothetical protein